MANTQRLARVFVELADTLVEDFDMVEFLQILSERCVELLGADAAGLTLADQRGDMQLLACTEDRARVLELLALEVRDGPCLECYFSSQAITNVSLAEAKKRWPRFSAAAVAAGFLATHALPMRLRGEVIGALTLYTSRGDPLDEDTLTIGQAMADVATIGLLHERNLFDQQILSEQLQAALHSRVLIEQAKGMLAAQGDITVSVAFARMRAHARQNNMTLVAVAKGVVQRTIADSMLVQS